MIKVYLLPVESLNNINKVVGIEYIHHAILTYGVTLNTALLVQDTTTEEDLALSALAIEVREPMKKEVVRLQTDLAELPTGPVRNYYTELDKVKVRLKVLEEK